MCVYVNVQVGDSDHDDGDADVYHDDGDHGDGVDHDGCYGDDDNADDDVGGAGGEHDCHDDADDDVLQTSGDFEIPLLLMLRFRCSHACITVGFDSTVAIFDG